MNRIAMLCGISMISCSVFAQSKTKPDSTLTFPGEKHFKNIRQLTFGGDNAEACFSNDGKAISFQRTAPKDGISCDQIFYGLLPKSAKDAFKQKLVSTGKGRTTCAYMMPDNQHVLYASTHLASPDCLRFRTVM